MAKSDSSGAQTPSGEGESASWLGVTSPRGESSPSRSKARSRGGRRPCEGEESRVPKEALSSQCLAGSVARTRRRTLASYQR